jgi:hypothetical protein
MVCREMIDLERFIIFRIHIPGKLGEQIRSIVLKTFVFILADVISSTIISTTITRKSDFEV